ncbi:MAG: 6-bladed beta-propeller [Candidatus Aegiribacteria sp.]|nr:6-bladed beta-propeller [Candidatus Aegiribacteria sp.]
MKLILVLSIVLFWMLSCGSTESETEQVIENSHTSSGIEDYVFPIADSYLHISDSIGIDMGDSNYVFGAVSSATLTTDGNIAVLDLQKIVISLFTTDGEFIRNIGRRGSGPGEFLYPAAIASRPEGGFLVSDLMGNKLINYDSNFEYVSEQTGFYPSSPLAFVAIEGMEIIALKSVIDESEDRISMGKAIGRWTMEDSDPSVTYYSSLSRFDPNDMYSSDNNAVLFAASVNGNVFTSQISPDVYSFTSWSRDGEELFTYIDEDFQPERRTQEDINAEIEQIDRRMSSQGLSASAIGWNPNPDEFAISGLFVDSMDRLWVSKGTTQTPYFDVYDLSGSHLFSAALDAGLRSQSWNTIIIHDRFICFDRNPEDYPKVFFGDLPGMDQ